MASDPCAASPCSERASSGDLESVCVSRKVLGFIGACCRPPAERVGEGREEEDAEGGEVGR